MKKCKNILKTLYITFEITSFPKYLFFIFDYHNYNILLSKKDIVINKLKGTFKNIINEEYTLLGGISMASSNYFKTFITKFVYASEFSFNFDNNYTYYHEGIKNNGNFLKLNNLLLFKKNKKLVLYIILYGKNN